MLVPMTEDVYLMFDCSRSAPSARVQFELGSSGLPLCCDSAARIMGLFGRKPVHVELEVSSDTFDVVYLCVCGLVAAKALTVSVPFLLQGCVDGIVARDRAAAVRATASTGGSCPLSETPRTCTRASTPRARRTSPS